VARTRAGASLLACCVDLAAELDGSELDGSELDGSELDGAALVVAPGLARALEGWTLADFVTDDDDAEDAELSESREDRVTASTSATTATTTVMMALRVFALGIFRPSGMRVPTGTRR
jgi:hypothetical protein